MEDIASPVQVAVDESKNHTESEYGNTLNEKLPSKKKRKKITSLDDLRARAKEIINK